MRVSIMSILAGGLALCACSLYFEQEPDDSSDPCVFAGPTAFPGYPFDVSLYQQSIWPMTQRACGVAGCHAPQSGGFGFRVWADDGATCSMIQSFNDLYASSDYIDSPARSRVLRVIEGSERAHPLLFTPGTDQYDQIFTYIWDAWARFQGNRAPGSPFDTYVFEEEIQPMLDGGSCSVSGCHHPSSAVAGFALHPFPSPDSPEMADNLARVVEYVDFVVLPENTALFQRATDRHGGTSVVDPGWLLEWIEAAYNQAGY